MRQILNSIGAGPDSGLLLLLIVTVSFGMVGIVADVRGRSVKNQFLNKTFYTGGLLVTVTDFQGGHFQALVASRLPEGTPLAVQLTPEQVEQLANAVVESK
jgi:hypothetical protein